MENEEKIQKEFEELVDDLTDSQFWEYTRSWFNVKIILDTMKNWDVEAVEQAIKEINRIKEKTDGKQLEILKKDIQDLKEKLLYTATKPIKATKEKFVGELGLERKKEIREIRGILKDKLTTYNLIMEAERVEK